MTYSTILVHLDHHAATKERVRYAAMLAEHWQARLVGLHAEAPLMIPGYPLDGTIAMTEDVLLEAANERRLLAKTMFTQTLASLPYQVAYEWRAIHQSADAALAKQSRYADLVIVGQPVEDDVNGEDFPATLALDIARPVLMTPRRGESPWQYSPNKQDQKLARHVLIAWNGSTPAVRAVALALPWLKAAQQVSIICVNLQPEDAHSPAPGIELSLYLASHGISAEIANHPHVDIPVAKWLQERAEVMGADCIVMGSYGHRRLQERLLGGVTRSIVAESTIPVFMAH